MMIEELFPVTFATIQVFDSMTGEMLDSYTCTVEEKEKYEAGARQNWINRSRDVRFAWVS